MAAAAKRAILEYMVYIKTNESLYLVGGEGLGFLALVIRLRNFYLEYGLVFIDFFDHLFPVLISFQRVYVGTHLFFFSEMSWNLEYRR